MKNIILKIGVKKIVLIAQLMLLVGLLILTFAFPLLDPFAVVFSVVFIALVFVSGAMKLPMADKRIMRMHISEAQEFKKWSAERQDHPPQIKLGLEAVIELEKHIQSLDKIVVEEIENRDYWEGKATRLAESVGKYFSESVGEHSSANCPINNAHELLNQIDGDVNDVITPESLKSIIDYIDEGEPDLNVVKGELSELIARNNRTYCPVED